MTTKTDEQELLPCPFCGEAAYFERHGTHRQSCIVACESCGCSLETGETGHACGGMWNRRAALQTQSMAPEISRDLLGGIVDQVFGGAIEDTTVIEDIYRVIAREFALQSQDREDAAADPLQGAADWLLTAIEGCTSGDMQYHLLIGPNRAQRLIDHARRVEGADDA